MTTHKEVRMEGGRDLDGAGLCAGRVQQLEEAVLDPILYRHMYGPDGQLDHVLVLGHQASEPRLIGTDHFAGVQPITGGKQNEVRRRLARGKAMTIKFLE